MPAQRAGGRTAAADSGFLRTAAQLRAVRGLQLSAAVCKEKDRRRINAAKRDGENSANAFFGALLRPCPGKRMRAKRPKQQAPAGHQAMSRRGF